MKRNLVTKLILPLFFSVMLCSIVNTGDAMISAPHGLEATVEGSNVTLSWEEPTMIGGGGSFEYTIYRGISESSMEQIGKLINPSELIYEDEGLEAGEYFYQIKAQNGAGVEFSDIIAASIGDTLLAITGLSVGIGCALMGTFAIFAMYKKKRTITN